MTHQRKPVVFAVAARTNLCVLLACCACTLSVHADENTITRPVGEDGGPTPIYVAMGLLDVDEIDGAAQSFTVNLYLNIRWFDPRLKHSGPGHHVLPLHEVWHPQLLFVNQQKIWPTFPEVVHVKPDGEVEYRQRVWGPFSQPLEVHDFPFDTQDFEIRLASAGETADDITYQADPENQSGLAERFSLPDWRVLSWELDFTLYKPMGSREGIASFALIFHARRYASHYVVKVIVPLIFIVAMSWIVFWVDPTESGTQIGVATTAMLTLIAYRFMVGGHIPIVPYLTRMDIFILGSTILVFTALAQAVITSLMAHREKVVLAKKVDVWCRFIFPTMFVLILIFSFFCEHPSVFREYV